MRYTLECIIILWSFVFINANEPELSILSPQTVPTVFNDKTTIDVKANSTIRLICEGSQKIYWTFPDNVPVI
jgi:hypothetical protein